MLSLSLIVHSVRVDFTQIFVARPSIFVSLPLTLVLVDDSAFHNEVYVFQGSDIR